MACETCRTFVVDGIFELASIVLDGHHPDCPTGQGQRRSDYGTIADLVELVERRDAEIRKLKAKVALLLGPDPGMDTILEQLGLPASTVRADASANLSGVAMIASQVPLSDARSRRPPDPGRE